jgi:hypothetical protein
MRVDDGEHVAAIERLAEGGDESGIEAAPIEAVEDGDTIPNEALEGDDDELEAEAEDEGEEDEAEGGEVES